MPLVIIKSSKIALYIKIKHNYRIGMTADLLKNDQFLQEKDIQIERSSFLADHYARKAFALRDSYNPRDPHGSRLSHFWQ